MPDTAAIFLMDFALLLHRSLLLAHRPVLLRHGHLSKIEQRGHMRHKLHGFVHRIEANGIVEEEEKRKYAWSCVCRSICRINPCCCSPSTVGKNRS